MKKGFTLIELLVVISIIGVLSSTILGSLSDARSQARDARRLQDVRSIKTALEVYYANNGQYPATSWQYSHTSSWDNLTTLLGGSLPIDPINEAATTSSGAYSYSYFAHPSSDYCEGHAYMLLYNLENSIGNDPDDGVTFCNGSTFAYGNVFVTGVSPAEN